MNKPLGEVCDFIKIVATNHQQWGNEIGNNLKKISSSKFEVDGVDLILTKFDALNKRFDKFEKGKASGNIMGTSNISRTTLQQTSIYAKFLKRHFFK